jgi:hypothetical protein
MISGLMAQVQQSEVETATADADNPYAWVDILTFCESNYYLGCHLYPWQRLTLKALYFGAPGNTHLKLMDDPEPLCKNCVWNGNVLGLFSPCWRCVHHSAEARIAEAEAFTPDLDPGDRREFRHLLKKGVADQFINEMGLIKRDLPEDSDARTGGSVQQQFLDKLEGIRERMEEFRELVLVMGRRSGKSMLVSIIALYETYRLIQMGDPQARFGNLSEGSTITILNVAVNENQAEKAVFSKVRSFILDSPYFKTKISPGSLKLREVRFTTPHDEEVNREAIRQGLPQRAGTIQLVSGTSNSSGQVGLNIIVTIVDEMAEMIAEGSKLSADDLYSKLSQSSKTFRGSSKILCISNPLTRDGKFFDLYSDSFRDERMLMLQVPSYSMNPTLGELEEARERNQAALRGELDKFSMQVGARFLGGAAHPLIPPEYVDRAMSDGPDLHRVDVGNPNKQYYCHVDLAKNSDFCCVAVLHPENSDMRQTFEAGQWRPAVYVDQVRLWTPDPDTNEPVDMSAVEQYLLRLSQNFNLVSITTDQWNSISMIQNLQRAGLPMRETTFTASYKEHIFQCLLDLFRQDRIILYRHEPEEYDNKNRKVMPVIPEIVDQLKFATKRYNANSSRVEAMPGHHDDIPACIAGAAYVIESGNQVYASLPRVRTASIPWR